MREILFRGKICRDCKGVTTQKRYKAGLWAFGDLSHTNYNPPLIDQNNDDPVPVDPETVGQYTGLTDKNGTKIFEGDIVTVQYEQSDGRCACECKEVIYDAKECCWYPMRWEESCDFCDGWTEIKSLEVIGNIHDNPELLENENDRKDS